jgi:hypothetical protein
MVASALRTKTSADERVTLCAGASDRSKFVNALRRFVQVVAEVLREIFDENAYARYLARESKPASATAYAEFVQEKYKVPVKRCC